MAGGCEVGTGGGNSEIEPVEMTAVIGGAEGAGGADGFTRRWVSAGVDLVLIS